MNQETRSKQQELTRLRRRVAAIDRKYARSQTQPVLSPKGQKPARWFIEEWSQGEITENPFGRHFRTERIFPSHKRHGSADIGALADLPDSLLSVLAEPETRCAPPHRWAFLDTETTPLTGEPGACAFLIGVGRITREGFRIRQFFMREYAEERSVLAGLASHLNEFDVLITYNGKTYDQPLLETRYRILDQDSPFSRLHHVDILHGARRLWKLRLNDCRLMHLEQNILGVYREGDLPGELIPYVYFEYLRSREAQHLVPIFHHNAIDILSLACLTAIVPAAFSNPDRDSLAQVGVSRGEDLAGVARWLAAAGEHEPALELFNHALAAGLPDAIMFAVLWQTAMLQRKLARSNAALHTLTDLAGCKNEYQSRALEELAKHYEHDERNYALALEFTRQAFSLTPSSALLRRKARLEKRLAKSTPHT